MKKIAVLTGAGISAESGIKTFRDADGLWEGHDIYEVASPQGWRNNPALVLDFYNQRRRQLLQVSPNAAHFALADLANTYQVVVITQNVDNLHEQAGSPRVIHLHGELLKVRSTFDPSLVYDWRTDLLLGDRCQRGSQLRPHIVWFGEAVPMMEVAAREVATADALLIVGTSMQVYPAASLIHAVEEGTPIFFVDPRPAVNENEYRRLTVIAENATTGVPKAIAMLGSIV